MRWTGTRAGRWPSTDAGRSRCSRPASPSPREYALPCQVSLEEYMACAIGGCAGCAVRVRTAGGPAMKRVCVDGPVFDGHSVVFGA